MNIDASAEPAPVEASTQPAGPSTASRLWNRFRAPMVHAAIAAGAGLALGTAAGFQHSASFTSDLVNQIGRGAAGLGAGFTGQLISKWDIRIDDGQMEGTATLHTWPWLLSLASLIVLACVTHLWYSRQGRDLTIAERWKKSASSGIVFGIILALLILLPSAQQMIGPSELYGPHNYDLTTNIWLLLIVSIPLATLAAACGHARVSIRRWDAARLGLSMPSWFAIPSKLAAAHVAWIALVTTLATFAYNLQHADQFRDSFLAGFFSPLVAINIGTAFGGVGHSADMISAGLPSLVADFEPTITLVSGRPVWLSGVILIAAIIGVLAAAVALHLRRPQGMSEWRGVPMTLIAYTAFGALIFLVSQVSDSTAGVPDSTHEYLGLSPWAILAFTATAVLVEVLSRVLAPGLLRLMPGLVRKYGIVPPPLPEDLA